MDKIHVFQTDDGPEYNVFFPRKFIAKVGSSCEEKGERDRTATMKNGKNQTRHWVESKILSLLRSAMKSDEFMLMHFPLRHSLG